MISENERACLCALNRIFGYKPRTALALMENLGSAEAVFGAGAKVLDELLGPYSGYKDKIREEEAAKSMRELQDLRQNGSCFIGISEEDYPALLRECEDPPVGLYVKSGCSPGEIFAPSRKMISVVGTREISPYGREWCGRIVRSLAGNDVCIVSGLAYGTDITAHLSALDCGLATIAVMATGTDSVYPYRHKAYADRIAASPFSALVTDYPPGTSPLANNFLRRNRIIAGVSQATVLVESKIKGGGMMTARLAFSYSRDVYALPGRVDDVNSRGCNKLIALKNAEAIEDLSEFAASLGLKGCSCIQQNIISAAEKFYSGREELSDILAVINIIKKNRGCTPEDISSILGLPVKSVRVLTAILEADGFIEADLLGRCTVLSTKTVKK